MAYFIAWVILIVVVGVVAANKGRSVTGWVLLAVFLAPLVLLILLALPKNPAVVLQKDKEREQRLVLSGELKICPFCAEAIRGNATVCRYCGREVPAKADMSAFPTCRRCGTVVLATTVACPKCGVPHPGRRKKRFFET